jgi:hypothetical protein
VRCTPPHKGGHQRTIVRLEAIGHRALDRFGGQRHLQLVQFLVQIDHQQVQAVAAMAVGACQGVDGGTFHQVVLGRGGDRQVLQPLLITARHHAVGDGLEWCDHFAQRRQQMAQDFVRMRNQVETIGVAPRQGDHLVQFRTQPNQIGDTADTQLGQQSGLVHLDGARTDVQLRAISRLCRPATTCSMTSASRGVKVRQQAADSAFWRSDCPVAISAARRPRRSPQEPVMIDRLLDEVDRLRAEGLPRRIDVAMAGHHDHRQPAAALEKTLLQVRPSIPGMRMSISRQPYQSGRRAARKLSASANSATERPCRPSSSPSASRTDGSSSTMNTVFDLMCHRRLFPRSEEPL